MQRHIWWQLLPRSPPLGIVAVFILSGVVASWHPTCATLSKGRSGDVVVQPSPGRKHVFASRVHCVPGSMKSRVLCVCNLYATFCNVCCNVCCNFFCNFFLQLFWNFLFAIFLATFSNFSCNKKLQRSCTTSCKKLQKELQFFFGKNSCQKVAKKTCIKLQKQLHKSCKHIEPRTQWIRDTMNPGRNEPGTQWHVTAQDSHQEGLHFCVGSAAPHCG